MLGLERPPANWPHFAFPALATGAAYVAVSNYASWGGLPDPQMLGAVWGGVVGVFGFTLAHYVRLAEYALYEWSSVERARAMYGREDGAEPEPEPEPVKPAPRNVPNLNAPDGWQNVPGRTVYTSAVPVTGLALVDPPPPDWVTISQVQTFCRGVIYDHAALTFSEWVTGRRVFSKDGQWKPFAQFLQVNDLARRKYPMSATSTIELTDRGRAWCEEVLRAYGPPPLKLRKIVRRNADPRTAYAVQHSA